jgi:hypothetical protein
MPSMLGKESTVGTNYYKRVSRYGNIYYRVSEYGRELCHEYVIHVYIICMVSFLECQQFLLGAEVLDEKVYLMYP